jgi:hypothetical protein
LIGSSFLPLRGVPPVQIHLALALAVLVLAPLAALVGLGSRLAEEQTREVERRFEAVIAARLDETAAAAAQAIDGLEGELLAATADLPADSAGLAGAGAQRAAVRAPADVRRGRAG